MKSYEETIRSVHSKISMYEAEKRRKRMEIAGAAAAVLPVCAIAAGAVCLLRDDGLTQQSSNPEAVIQEVATEPVLTAAEPVHTAPTVTAQQTATAGDPVQTEAAESAATETAQTESLNMSAKTALTETTSHADTILKTETTSKSTSEPEIIGDLDLDGRITLADRAWAELIHSAEMNFYTDLYSLVPLTDAQLRQCKLISGSEWYPQPFDPTADYDRILPLHDEEINAILRTTDLIYQYGQPQDLTVKEYLENQEYYDHLIASVTPEPWEDSRMDWSALGLPEHPAKEDWLSAFDWQYVLEHTETKEKLIGDEIRTIRKTCQERYEQYSRMKAALCTEPELSPERIRWNNLMQEIETYQYIGMVDDTLVSGESSCAVPALTWENLLAELEAAKEWNFKLYA